MTMTKRLLIHPAVDSQKRYKFEVGILRSAACTVGFCLLMATTAWGQAISSISPTVGPPSPVGSSVTIQGTGFGATQGTSTVTFGGIPATPSSWSDANLVVQVPVSLSAGFADVVVTVNGVASNAESFLCIDVIAGIAPNPAAIGAPITISGAGFGATQGNSTVTFNGTAATPTSWNAGSIVVPVPAGATTGNVVVTVNGFAANPASFTVGGAPPPPPSIASVSPTAGSAGATATISGSNFGSAQGASEVFVGGGGAPANVMKWSDTSIAITIPNGATSGPLSVIVNNQASNSVNFAVAPAISGMTPASGPVGASVTISGTNFGSSQGANTIAFNGVAATPASWNTTTIVVPVPSGATTGNVVMMVNSVASNTAAFSVTPNISSVSPTTGSAGTAVTIAGTSLGSAQGANTVTFGGAQASPTSWSDTQIVVPVPSGANTGNVVVNAGGLSSNGVSFGVISSISSLSPTSGVVGAVVVITGTAFGATQSASTVSFDGIAATPISWSSTSIAVQVPSGATSGNLVVTVGGAASNGVNFTVTTAPVTQGNSGLTLNVNTTVDTVDANPGDGICADSQGNCSVRAAVMESNAFLAEVLADGLTSSVTIMVPAGAYTLTIPPNELGNASGGHLDITAGPLSIVGANVATTIIQAGTGVNANGIPNGIDKVFSINPPFPPINPAANLPGFDTSLSNLTIRYGLNTSTADPFGGAFDWDAGTDGGGTLNIINCNIANNATLIANSAFTTSADGGGVALTNEIPNPAQEGMITISGSTFQGNIAQDSGGGIFEAAFPMEISNTQILNNQAVDNPSTQGGQSGGTQTGGGLSVLGPTVGSQTVIQGSTIGSAISGNIAGADGGGIYTTAGVQLVSDTLSGNHAGGAGGGLFSNTIMETTQVVGTNITLNVAGQDGGGVEVDNSSDGNSLNVTFSRIVGNTATAGNGLNNIAGTVTATDNWWGCNQGPGSSPCDLVNDASNTATAIFNPWLTLSSTASPASILVDTSTTLTASVLQDSASTVFTAGNENLTALAGLHISFQNAVGGTLANGNTTIQSNGTATSTFTGTVAGTGLADAVVDQATATANINVQDFSIAITPASPSVVLGNSTNYTLTVTPIDGFIGTVTITNCGIAPSGPSVSGCPSSLTITGGAASATLTVTTSPSNAAQNYTVSATGSSAGLQHSASATLVAQDFSLSFTPASQSVVLGNAPSYTLTVAPINGFTGTVNISCSLAPSGPALSGCPSSVAITGGAGVINTITASTSTLNTPQSYSLNASGASGGQTRNAPPATLGAQNFSVSLTPASQNVLLGNSANYTMTVTPSGGFTGTVNINCSISPAGPTLSGCPSSLAITSGPVIVGGITVATTMLNTAQNYTISASGTNSGQTRNAPSATLKAQDFSVSITPASQTVVLGLPADYTLTVTPINGFTGTVTITNCVITPSGPILTGCPSSLTISSGASVSVPLTVTTTLSNTAESYTISASGGNSGQTRNAAPATLLAQNFSLTLTPASQNVVLGNSTNYTLTVTSINGFAGTVPMSCNIAPAGPTLSGCPSSVALTGGATPTYTVTVTTTPLNTADIYTLSATGTNSGQPRNASATLNAQDFSISLSPSTQGVVVGGPANYTGTVAPVNNFTGTVNLSCPSPAGISVTCPSSVTITSGPVNFTLAASTSATGTPGGPYTLAAIGTSAASPSDSRSASATLNTRDFSISLSPSTQGVVVGGTVNYTGTVAPANNFTGTVNLSCPNPAGISVTCPSSVTITSGPVNFTLAASTSTTGTPAGPYTLAAIGTSAAVPSDSRSASATLNTRDFSISLSPSTQGVTVGGTANYTGTVAPVNNFTGTVNLSCPSPAEISVTCPSSVTITSGPVNFTLAASTSATGTPAGPYTLAAIGTSAIVPSDSRSASATLNAQDFSISLSPSTQGVVVGGPANYTGTVAPVNNFTGTVNLSCPSPAGISVTCPSSVTITSGPVNFTLAASTSATGTPAGPYTLPAIGTSAAVPSDSRSASATLNAQDFSLSISPASITVNSGQQAAYTVTVSSLGGFASSVTLICSATPSGLTVACSPNPVSVPANGSATSTFTVSAPASVAAGHFTLSAAGSSASLSHTAAPATVTVATFATGSVTIDQTLSCSSAPCAAGTITINVGTCPAASFTYGGAFTTPLSAVASTLASNLSSCGAISAISSNPSGNQVTINIKSTATGASADYSLSASSLPTLGSGLPAGYSVQTSGPTLTGGGP